MPNFPFIGSDLQIDRPGRRWKNYPREAVGLSTTILTCSPEKKYPGSARKLGSLALLHKGKHGYLIALLRGGMFMSGWGPL